MQFNIYLDDELGERLDRFAQDHTLKRNGVIRKALKEWLDMQHSGAWPDSVLTWQGSTSVLDLADYGEALTPQNRDILF